MAAEIEKGVLSSILGKTDRNGDFTEAKVDPLTNTGVVSRSITIPWYLRGEMGDLKVGDEVLFVVFEDTSGMVLARCDGEWPGVVPGDVKLLGDLTLEDLTSQNVPSYNHHTHSGVETGGGKTGTPS